MQTLPWETEPTAQTFRAGAARVNGGSRKTSNRRHGRGIEAMLAEIEAGMCSLETMDADQISDMMKIYREEQEAVMSPLEGPNSVQ